MEAWSASKPSAASEMPGGNTAMSAGFHKQIAADRKSSDFNGAGAGLVEPDVAQPLRRRKVFGAAVGTRDPVRFKSCAGCVLGGKQNAAGEDHLNGFRLHDRARQPLRTTGAVNDARSIGMEVRQRAGASLMTESFTEFSALGGFEGMRPTRPCGAVTIVPYPALSRSFRSAVADRPHPRYTPLTLSRRGQKPGQPSSPARNIVRSWGAALLPGFQGDRHGLSRRAKTGRCHGLMGGQTPFGRRGCARRTPGPSPRRDDRGGRSNRPKSPRMSHGTTFGVCFGCPTPTSVIEWPNSSGTK